MQQHRALQIIDLTHSLTRYAAGITLQNHILAQRRAGAVEDTILLLQHQPVFTLGKRGSDKDFRRPQLELRAEGIDIEVAPRGGEVTFHGPGQLVAYPIINLRQAGLGARAFVEAIEDSVVTAAARFGVQARGRVPGATGVWVDDRKLAAIGVKIAHGFSSHGVALNVSTRLTFFDLIVPCGIPDKAVTSLSVEVGQPVAMPAAVNQLVAGLLRSLRVPDGADVHWWPPADAKRMLTEVQQQPTLQQMNRQ